MTLPIITPASTPYEHLGKDAPLGKKLAASLSTRIGRAAVIVVCLLWTVPTFGLLVSSFRPENDIKTTGWWTFFTHPAVTLQNYRDVLSSSGGNADNFGKYFLNTVRITLPATFIPIVIAALAAYALAWMSFKGRDWVFVGVVALMVVPIQMAMVPLLRLLNLGGHLTISGHTYTIFPNLDINSSVVSVWIAHTCFALPLAIFLLKNFIQALPKDLIEAARIDGASHLTVFLKVVLPLAVPALASLAIFQFLWVWNDFLVGKVFGPSDLKPMTWKLNDLVGSKGQDWQRLTAGAFVSMIVPLGVFFSLQRYFVRGLTAGAVKG
ncbi:MAG: alpha-glucoside transport system permease protein AglG [Acidimicrobiales bacterium]|nr:alpha-glucoside transport system permease protein AglG [Acidimicrobiales bacterium]